jgi:hypothetical protein
MKKASKNKTSPSKKRDLFSELKEGVVALAEARQGKRTLRTHEMPAPGVKSVGKARLCRA